MVSPVPNPHVWATASVVSPVDSSSCRAVSTRTRSTKRPGGTPTSRVNTRVKFRGLIAADLRHRRDRVIVGGIAAHRVDGSADTVGCPPDGPRRAPRTVTARLVGEGTSRATAPTVCAQSTPRSSSTSARARSMPAVTPADVHTPSWTWIGSASTTASGKSCASCAARAQCVVTRRPAISPPRRAGTLPNRPNRRVERASPPNAANRRVRRRVRARRTPAPPATRTVSIGPAIGRVERSGNRRCRRASPLSLSTSPPPFDTTRSS